MTLSRRHTLLLLLLIGTIIVSAQTASAQHYIGFMGGWGGGSGRFKPTQETGYEWGLYTGGLSYKFYSETKYVGGIEIDLLFTQKGFNYDLEYLSDSSYHRRINAVEIPLIWQPHFYVFQRHARLFLNLGIQFSYNINSTYKYESKQKGVYESGTYTMQLNRDNRFSYGLCGGAGLAFLLGQQRRFELSLEARYAYGFGDILRNSNKYASNPERSALDNINVLCAFYYRIGKGGIRSTPSPGAALRMEQEATRRMIRRLDKMQEKGTLSDSIRIDSAQIRRMMKENIDLRVDSVLKRMTNSDSVQRATAPILRSTQSSDQKSISSAQTGTIPATPPRTPVEQPVLPPVEPTKIESHE